MKRKQSQPSKVSRPLPHQPEPLDIALVGQPLPQALSRWTGFLLYHVTGLAGQFYAQALASIGLSAPQVGVLQLLASEGPLVQARLGEMLSVDKASMVQVLNGIEQQSLIERRPHPKDKRSFMIHLLPAGAARLAEAEALNAWVNEQFFAELSVSERQTLHELLARLATNPGMYKRYAGGR